MPVLEKDTGINWVTRNSLRGLPGFRPATSAKINSYQLPEPPLSLPSEFENEQPDIEWQPHEERPYDLFGNLWRDRKRLDPNDPTA